METVGPKCGLTLSPEWLHEQNSQTSEQLQAELRDYTCDYGNFAGRPLLRLLNTMVFPEKAGCKLPVTGDICWVSGPVIL